MTKKKGLEIHTVIVDGQPSNFKAALTRSIMGVSWTKFKRKKQAFYKHRTHNSAIAQSVYTCIYESLLENLKGLSNFKLKTDLKPIWNENGKIEAISDINVGIYLKIGDL